MYRVFFVFGHTLVIPLLMLPEWFRNCSLHPTNLLPWCGRCHGRHVSGGGVVVAKWCVAKILVVVTVVVANVVESLRAAILSYGRVPAALVVGLPK